jgi:large subunit ribosomal protein L9
MKVLLIKDVYKLGRAGEVKKVANGYGRNYLIPQGLAVLATAGALKQADHIRQQADERRAIVNQEMSGIADLLSDLTLTFAAKAGETGKLYGSVTAQMIVDRIQEKQEIELNRRQVDSEPIRNLGTHKASIRLTVDLVPEVTVIVHREGEAAEGAEKEAKGEEEAPEEASDEEVAVETVAETEVAIAGEAVEAEDVEAETAAAEETSEEAAEEVAEVEE